jgi:hypothetical protein
MKKLFVLALAGVLFVSPFAMAGELSSADSDFLFSTEQIAVTAISAQEMQATQGEGLVSGLLTTLLAVAGPVLNDLIATLAALGL